MTTLNILFKTTSLCLAMALLVGCNDNDDNDSSTPAPRSNQTVNILAFNDFHGNLETYINRELSLLEFHKRVLAQAKDIEHPLLERLNFLIIFSRNLDEFFEIRVASLIQK
ncbi:hypothetical protein ACFMJX_24500, partial [Acinetobacter baumannii]